MLSFLEHTNLLNMTVMIRKTIPEDAEILAKIWLESLEDNDMVKLASPEGITPRRVQGATRRTLLDLEDPNALCLTAYEEESNTIMGCAVFRYYPDGKREEEDPNNEALQSRKRQDPVLEDSRRRDTKEKSIDLQRSVPCQPNIAADLDNASNRIFRDHVGERPHASESKK